MHTRHRAVEPSLRQVANVLQDSNRKNAHHGKLQTCRKTAKARMRTRLRAERFVPLCRGASRGNGNPAQASEITDIGQLQVLVLASVQVLIALLSRCEKDI